jgi:hypothetical protein
MILNNEKLAKYEGVQRRILHLTRRYCDGEDVTDAILLEYSRLCIPFKPSHTERAFAHLVKHLKKTRERLP